LRMTALLHDIGKVKTKSEKDGKISFINHESISSKLAKDILARLKYSADFIKKVCFLIENHMYPKMYDTSWKDSSVRRFANKLGEDIDNIRLLTVADTKNFDGELFDRVKTLEQKNMLLPKEELFNGNELIEIFNKPAGKWINDVKKYIKNLQFEDPKITKEEVLEKVKNLLKIQ